ncbi:DNA-binding response regulator [Flexivirga lutea]
MPRAATTPGLDAGVLAEIRVAQAWFWDGYYVRRGVDLQHRFGSEVSTVTDLDVLGYTFDPSLTCHKQIGEVKTGTSKSTPRPLDRALWSRGLRELVGAERGEITTAFSTSGAIRDACRRLGVTIQNMNDLEARENRLAIGNVNDVGSQGVTMAVLRKDVLSFVKSDAMLERGYWFLLSEVWFLEPSDAVKRTLGLIRELGKVWPPDTHLDATRAARWFFAEAISIVTLNLAIIAGEANTMDAATFRDMATARLATGDVPFYAMRKQAERVDEYVAKILNSLDAPADVRTSAMGAFLPVAPDYTEPLLELISRLAAEAAATARLPRQMDAMLFERLVRRRDLTPDVQVRLGMSPATERQIHLTAAFLRGQFGVPAPVDKVLTTALVTRDADAAIDGQAMLFGPPSSSDGAVAPRHGKDAD